MPWHVTMTASSQAQYDEMKAWYDHKTTCQGCGEARILSVVTDAVQRTLDVEVTDDGLDWTIYACDA